MKNSLSLKQSTFDSIEIQDSFDLHTDFHNQGYFIRDSRYFTLNMVKNDWKESDISNFVMKSLYNMSNGTPNSSRIIFLKRYTGEKVLLEIKSSDLKPDTLETILKTHRCTFYGTNYSLKKIFAHLMDDEKSSIVIDVMGWNSEYHFFAFADAILTTDDILCRIDEIGVIDLDGQYFYLPPYGLANKNDKDWEGAKRMKYRPGTIPFETWAKLFYQSSGDNAIIGILYSIMASYRDLIFNRLGFFPFLYLFGDKGTGKTQFTARLLSQFTSDTVGTPLNNATIVGINRTVGSLANGLFYFKEYSDITETSAEDFILSSYDGAGRKTGIKSNDTKTKDFPILSAIIFDGNALPKKSSILSRMILLSFENTKFSEQEKEAFDQLREASKHGFGQVLREILSHRKLIKEKLNDTYEDVERNLRNTIQQDKKYHELKSADERTFQHAALLLTVFQITHTALSFPFDYETVKRVILDNTINITGLLQDTSIISLFWESFVYCYKKRMIEELLTDSDLPGNKKSAIYNIKWEEKSTVPILQLKLKDFYPYYVRYCRDNGIRYLDTNSLRLILTSRNNRSFIESHQKSRSKSYTDKNLGSCYQFRLMPTDVQNVYLLDDIEISL